MSIPVPTQHPLTSLPLPDPEAYPGEPREYARALMQRKDEIEQAIDTLNDVLASQGTTSSTPLVDPEGYPRGDIDVYSIRHTRSALAHLATDLRTVNSLLPNALAQAFQSEPSTSSSSSQPTLPVLSQPAPPSSSPPPSTEHSEVNGHGDPVFRGAAFLERAIARVNSVEPNSPAVEAGLRAGDEIVFFSGIAAATGGTLRDIGTLVQRSEGVALVVIVRRGTDISQLRLTPRNGWGGRGSLGCHILPA